MTDDERSPVAAPEDLGDGSLRWRFAPASPYRVVRWAAGALWGLAVGLCVWHAGHAVVLGAEASAQAARLQAGIMGSQGDPSPLWANVMCDLLEALLAGIAAYAMGTQVLGYLRAAVTLAPEHVTLTDWAGRVQRMAYADVTRLRVWARPSRWLGPPGPVDLLLTARGRTLHVCGVLPEADSLVSEIAGRCRLTPFAPQRFARSYLRRPGAADAPRSVPVPEDAAERGGQRMAAAGRGAPGGSSAGLLSRQRGNQQPRWTLIPAAGPPGAQGVAWVVWYVAATLGTGVAIPLAAASATQWLAIDGLVPKHQPTAAAMYMSLWGLLCTLALGYATLRRSREIVLDGEWLVVMGLRGREFEVHLPSVSALQLAGHREPLSWLVPYVDCRLQTPDGERAISGLLRGSGRLVREVAARGHLSEAGSGQYVALHGRATDRENPATRRARHDARSRTAGPPNRIARQLADTRGAIVALVLLAGLLGWGHLRVGEVWGEMDADREAAGTYSSAGRALSAATESFHRSHGRYPATQSEYESLRGEDGAPVLAELQQSAQASGIGSCRLSVCDPNPRSSAYPLATVVGDGGTLEVLKGGRVRVTWPDGRTELM